MVNVSNVVRKLVMEKPMIYDGLIEGVISHAALAEYLQEDIEKELGKDVNLPAIVMAIRRYSETLEEKSSIKEKEFRFNSEIIMKTGLADVTVVKSPNSLRKVKELYSIVDYNRGDTLNIIEGNYEITIVITEKHLARLKEVLKEEKLLNVEKDLVSISVSFSSDFLHTPGILAKVTRKLAWEDINVYENISTMTELIFITDKKDSVRAYRAFESLISEQSRS